MTKGRLLFFAIVLIFPSCKSAGNNPIRNFKELNIGPFQISVPANWKYDDPGEQEDSFVGQIWGPHLMLSFDCSDRGYANNLLQTEKEYLNSRDWWDHSLSFPFWGTKFNIHSPDQIQKNKFAKADYIADLTYQGKTIYLPITIPATIKSQNIKLDSNDTYVFKTIWPKIAGKGMTGIYIHSRKSSFDFQMNGYNLSSQNEKLALLSFKTIQFKHK